MVAVQMRQHDGADVARLDGGGLERGERGRAAIDQRAVGRSLEPEARLEAPAGPARAAGPGDVKPHPGVGHRRRASYPPRIANWSGATRLNGRSRGSPS